MHKFFGGSFRILLTSLLAFIWWILPISGEEIRHGPMPQEIERIKTVLNQRIPDLMQKREIPGLSLAVIRHGKIAWKSGFGRTNLDNTRDVDSDTVFEAASLSKPVFSYLVLKLASQRNLELDKPLCKYASEEFIKKKFLGPDFSDKRFKQITTRMVLNHSTGFPNWRSSNTIEIKSNPGEKFSYSAEGMYLLQVVIENIFSEPLNSLMKKHVFEPLKMLRSSYLWQPDLEKDSVCRHDMMGESRGLRKHKRALAPATLQTSVSDFANFLVALLTGDGLEIQIFKEMIRPQSTYSKEGFADVDWGLGVGLETSEKGETGLWHWGDNTYAQAFFLAFYESKNGVVFFANSFYGLSLVGPIVETVLGKRHPVLECGIIWPYIRLSPSLYRLVSAVKKSDFKSADREFRIKFLPDYKKKDIYQPYVLNDLKKWLEKANRQRGIHFVKKLEKELIVK